MSKTPQDKHSSRCFECAWCAPEPETGSGAVCMMLFDKPLSSRELWRKACADFEPLGSSRVLATAKEEPVAGDPQTWNW